MIRLRSALFQLAFYVWTVGLAILYAPALLGPRRITVGGMELWSKGVIFLLRHLARIRFEVRGPRPPPDQAVIVAAKHQSAFDTVIFHALLKDPSLVMKRELLLIPIYGWQARKVGMIAVDRSEGASALRHLVQAARQIAAARRPIVIFPQGTRTAPGASHPYQPGIAALYSQLGLPVVPLAVNSGLHWPRRRFVKLPGTIVFEFLPPIPPGKKRRDFMAELETTIEGACQRLIAAESPGIGRNITRTFLDETPPLP